jgi:tetratricopeptide (TPR) repeat protein
MASIMGNVSLPSTSVSSGEDTRLTSGDPDVEGTGPNTRTSRTIGPLGSDPNTKIWHEEFQAALDLLVATDFEAAEVHARRACLLAQSDLSPMALGSNRLLGQVLIERGKYKEAYSALTFRMGPEPDEQVTPDLALCCLRLGRLQEAEQYYAVLPVEHFTSAIDSSRLPQGKDAHSLEVRIIVARGLDRSFRSSGDVLATRDFREALRMAPNNPEIARQLLRTLPPEETLPYAAIMSLYGKGKTKERGDNRLLGFPEGQRNAALEAAK